MTPINIRLYRNLFFFLKEIDVIRYEGHPLPAAEMQLICGAQCSHWMPRLWILKWGVMPSSLACTWAWEVWGGRSWITQTTVRPWHSPITPLCCETWWKLKRPQISRNLVMWKMSPTTRLTYGSGFSQGSKFFLPALQRGDSDMLCYSLGS